MKSIHQLSFWAVTLAVGLSAQEPSIRGKVVDATSGNPLIGANITLQGTEYGAASDDQGNYSIFNVSEGTYTIRADMIGYKRTEKIVDVALGVTTEIDFEMSQAAVALDAVVVTGTAGGQLARSLGNTVGKFRARNIAELAPAHTFESLLSGALPGVNVDVGGGEIGTGANIRIRGASSISLNSQPLIYVDGVRVNGSNADRGGGYTGLGVDNRVPPSRLNDINPEDIESVEVIKGPAAATLYGTEASNGVINIITRKGFRGAPRFNVRIGRGANWIPDPEEFFPETYYRCVGTSGDCTPGEVVPFNVLREDRERNGNTWFQTGQPQNYGANVSGGTEYFSYYYSLDWQRDEGIVSYNWKNQLNGRANLNWTPNENLDVEFGIGTVRSTLRSASANQSVTTAILWSCPAPGCEEGSGLPSAVDGAYRGYIGYLPEVIADDVEGRQGVTRTMYSLNATHRPTNWFTQRLTWGADWTETNTTELYRPIDGPGHFTPMGRKSAQRQTTQYLTTDYSATATLEPFAGLRLATSSGVQYYQKLMDWIYATGSIFPVAALETVNAGAQKDADEGFVENKTVGAYIQEQVSLRERIFLTAALRGDDNSAFGKNFDFVLYPKFSTSWVVADESAPMAATWVNRLKLRAAWGQAGQQPDVFAALRTYEPAVGPDAVATLTPQNIGNADLKPEVGEELEVGFDGSFLNDRIEVQFTYYDQKRKDALISVPVKPSVGFPGFQWRNLGEVANSGIELGVNGDVRRGANWGLSLGLSFSANDNELVDLGGLPPQILQSMNYTTGWAHQLYVQGFPLGAIFLKKVVSADIQGTGADAVATNVMCEGGELVAGTTDLSRGGGATVPCDEAPHIFRGAPIPTKETSLTGNLTLFKNLQLFAQVDYMGGHTMINGTAAGAHLFFRNTREILERDDPILLGYESLGRDGINQGGLIDASFIRLRRISATYTVPSSLSARFGADRITISLSGHNLWTIWQATKEVFGYPVLDPEQRITQGTSTDPGGLSAYVQEAWTTIKRFQTTIRVSF